jgi:cytochrome c biogenesis protein
MATRFSNNIAAVVQGLWRFFISLRLTFVLLGLIGAGAVVGMSFDQTLTYDQFLDVKPQTGLASSLMSFFELYDVFHSWWFSLAIFLLALNLIACSIERLPRIYFDYVRPRPYLSKRRLLGLPFSTTIKVTSKERALAVVANFCGVAPDHARLPQKDDYFFKEHAGLGRFGVYVVHIALLIVMFSSIYATQTGVDGHVMIEEGKMARFVSARGASGVTYNYDLGFYVGCDDFRLRTFVDNSPMEFESDLFISTNRDDRPIKKTVRVNEPLSYAGFTFYQSSYRPVLSERIIELEIAEAESKSRHRVKLNEPITLLDGNIIAVEKLYEDFAGLGQALRVNLKDQEKGDTYFHIFRRYKDYDAIVRADNFSVTFLDADQRYATGLSVGKVPGIAIIFSGFLLLLVGLYLCFFTTPVRYFARIEKTDGSFHVVLAAAGFRMPNVVKEIFTKKIDAINANFDEHHHDHA